MPANIYWPIGIAIESSSGGINVYFQLRQTCLARTPGYSSNTTGGAAPAFFVNTSVTALDIRDNVLHKQLREHNVNRGQSLRHLFGIG